MLNATPEVHLERTGHGQLMRTQLLAHVTEAGHPVNEDIGGLCDNLVWLLDGSTTFENPQLGDGSDAAWLVAVGDEALRSAVHGNGTNSIDVMRHVANRIRVALSEAGWPLGRVPPSAAATVCILNETTLDCSMLGDVVTVHAHDNATRVVDQYAIDSIVRERRRLLDGSLGTTDAALATAVRATRRGRMNQPDGYWTLSNDPAAADHARHESIPVEPGDRLLLCSDGFARILAWYALRDDWMDVMNELAAGRAKALLSDLRHAEDADKKLDRAAPTVRHDDATAVLVEIVL